MTPDQQRLMALATTWRLAQDEYQKCLDSFFSDAPDSCVAKKQKADDAAEAFWSAVDGYLAQRTGEK